MTAAGRVAARIAYRFLSALVGACLALAGNTAGEAAGPDPVWIDTDPACGAAATNDVDDCWALLLAFRSGRIAVRGIGTVFGNLDEAPTRARVVGILGALGVATGRAALPPIHRGAGGPGDRAGREGNRAAAALARALEAEPLTVLALGPLTNIAAVLARRPDLAGRIRRIVAVAGQRPGERFFPGASRISGPRGDRADPSPRPPPHRGRRAPAPRAPEPRDDLSADDHRVD